MHTRYMAAIVTSDTAGLIALLKNVHRWRIRMEVMGIKKVAIVLVVAFVITSLDCVNVSKDSMELVKIYPLCIPPSNTNHS